MNRKIRITRARSGIGYQDFATVDLADDSQWPPLPQEVTEMLYGYGNDPNETPDSHEVEAGDGWRYRLLTGPASGT